MPHCVLEYSANIKDSVDFPRFFEKLHTLLAASGDIQLDQIKSRWIRREDYIIGNAAEKNAFVYLQISLLAGRSVELRKRLGGQAFELLTSLYPKSQKELTCSITLEMREMDRDTHFKITK